VVEGVTHAVTVLETIAARGLDTVDSLEVRDFKAMLQHDDPEAPGAKGNTADLVKDRVMALANVNQVRQLNSLPWRPAVPAGTKKAPCTAASADIHPVMAAPATIYPRQTCSPH
jgi:hypothetical protein